MPRRLSSSTGLDVLCFSIPRIHMSSCTSTSTRPSIPINTEQHVSHSFAQALPFNEHRISYTLWNSALPSIESSRAYQRRCDRQNSASSPPSHDQGSGGLPIVLRMISSRTLRRSRRIISALRYLATPTCSLTVCPIYWPHPLGLSHMIVKVPTGIPYQLVPWKCCMEPFYLPLNLMLCLKLKVG